MMKQYAKAQGGLMVILLAIIACLLLVGCNGDEPESPPATTTTTEVTTTTSDEDDDVTTTKVTTTTSQKGEDDVTTTKVTTTTPGEGDVTTTTTKANTPTTTTTTTKAPTTSTTTKSTTVTTTTKPPTTTTTTTALKQEELSPNVEKVDQMFGSIGVEIDSETINEYVKDVTTLDEMNSALQNIAENTGLFRVAYTEFELWDLQSCASEGRMFFVNWNGKIALVESADLTENTITIDGTVVPYEQVVESLGDSTLIIMIG